MGKYRKKPVVIDAVQWNGQDDFGAVVALGGDPARRVFTTGNFLNIETLEGMMLANPGDWIIRGVKGELYPCKDDIFRATYEPVETTRREGEKP